MNRFLLFATIFFAVPVGAQTEISAPDGWQTQARAEGARTFTPPDLAAGEKYSVTVYASMTQKGTLEKHLRQFAGPVGKKPGQLAAPLQVSVKQGNIVSGTGFYSGPNGSALGVVFVGVTLDGGQNVHLARTLFSPAPADLLSRYERVNLSLVSAMMERARRETGRNLVAIPRAVSSRMEPGGAPKPGIYAGNQFSKDELSLRLRVCLYPNGEFRATSDEGKDLRDRWGDLAGVGRYSFNPDSGMISFDDKKLHLVNTNGEGADADFCYFGRDAAGKATIYAERNDTFRNIRTSLVWVAPVPKRSSPIIEAARKEAAQREANRFKWTTAPGKGVKMAQIEGIWFHSLMLGNVTSTDLTLLLKDGTCYDDLPVPPDELDIAASRRNEPKSWGHWRKSKSGYEVKWPGAKWQDVSGFKVTPGAPQTRLSGQYSRGSSMNIGNLSSYSLFNVFFDKTGRFSIGSRSGTAVQGIIGDPNSVSTYSENDENGTSTSVLGERVAIGAQSNKKRGGGNAGTYAINGYGITLRYDDGSVTRRPFFFGSPDRKGLWFGGGYVALMD